MPSPSRSFGLIWPLLAALAIAPRGAAAEGFLIEPEIVFLDFGDAELDYAVDASGDRLAHLEADHEVGWRLGLGYTWTVNWDLVFRYTAVNGTERGSEEADDPDELFVPLVNPDDERIVSALGAEASLYQNLRWFDVEIGRRIGELERPCGRWFFGIRNVWYDRDAFVDYADVADLDGDPVFEAVSIEQRADFVGTGPRLGLEGHARFGDDSGWSFFGGGSAAVLFGDADLQHEEMSFEFSADKDPLDEQRLLGTDERTVFAVDANLGFAFEHECGAATFGIRFGYEASHWSDLVDEILIDTDKDGFDTVTRRSHDLLAHGAFFRIGWRW